MPKNKKKSHQSQQQQSQPQQQQHDLNKLDEKPDELDGTNILNASNISNINNGTIHDINISSISNISNEYETNNDSMKLLLFTFYVNKLREENDVLNSNIQLLQDELRLKEYEIKELKSIGIHSTNSEQHYSSNPNSQNLSNEIEDLKSQLREADEASSLVTQLNDENESLTRQVKQYKIELKDLKEKVDSLIDINDDYKSKFDYYELTLEENQLLLPHLKEKGEIIKKLNEELSQASADIEELRNINLELTETVDIQSREFDLLKSKNDEMNLKLANYEKQNLDDSTIQQQQQHKPDISFDFPSSYDEINDLNTKIKLKDDEIIELKKTMKELYDQINGFKNNTNILNESNLLLTRQLNELQIIINNLSDNKNICHNNIQNIYTNNTTASAMYTTQAKEIVQSDKNINTHQDTNINIDDQSVQNVGNHHENNDVKLEIKDDNNDLNKNRKLMMCSNIRNNLENNNNEEDNSASISNNLSFTNADESIGNYTSYTYISNSIHQNLPLSSPLPQNTPQLKDLNPSIDNTENNSNLNNSVNDINNSNEESLLFLLNEAKNKYDLLKYDYELLKIKYEELLNNKVENLNNVDFNNVDVNNVEMNKQSYEYNIANNSEVHNKIYENYLPVGNQVKKSKLKETIMNDENYYDDEKKQNFNINPYQNMPPINKCDLIEVIQTLYELINPDLLPPHIPDNGPMLMEDIKVYLDSEHLYRNNKITHVLTILKQIKDSI